MASLSSIVRKFLEADGSTDWILWPGGRGVLAVQGDMDGGTLTVQMKNWSDEGYGPHAAGDLEDSAGVAVAISGLADDDVRALEFSAPSGVIRATLSGSGLPYCTVSISKAL